MTGEAEGDAKANETELDRQEDLRRNRTIRFSDAEWEEVRHLAEADGAVPAEFVRDTVLALARDAGAAAGEEAVGSLAPLIERTFRYAWFVATERRDTMIREGREEEVDALVAEGRGLYDRLRPGRVG